MKAIILTALFLAATVCQAQNVIDWDGVYRLQLTDFQSKATQVGEVNIYSLQSAVGMSFSFHMSNYEFMVTKNFNSKVNCMFTRAASSLIAPDENTVNALLNFARYEFDLCELYARRFRQSIYEEKGAFSNISFLQPLYDAQQKELNERHGLAIKETDIGIKAGELKLLHDEVLREIQALPDFCKTCKPVKKKNR